MSPSHFHSPARRGATSPHRRLRFLAGLAMAIATLGGLAPARGFAAANSLEYQVKAGFLFNFAKFVEWPGAALAPGASVRLGIVAPDEVFQLIEKSLAGKTVGDRPLIVERFTPAQLGGGGALPNIIFVHQDVFRPQSELGFTKQQLATLGEKHPVLLVGESAGFATSGGMIGFVQRGESLRFQVNLASAQRAGLKLSSRLSGLAEIVTTPTP